MDWGAGSVASGNLSNALTMVAPVSVQVPILVYEKIWPTSTDAYTVTTANFAAQMQYLSAAGYTAVTLQDVMNYRAGIATAPAKPVVITFDGGYEGVSYYALPILQQYNFKATAFICTGDTRPASQAADPTAPDTIMSVAELQQLVSSNLFSIENDTVDYDDLTTLTAAQVATEISGAAETLTSELSLTQPIRFLAYPYGSYNAAVQSDAWSAGYMAAVGGWGGEEPTAAAKYVALATGSRPEHEQRVRRRLRGRVLPHGHRRPLHRHPQHHRELGGVCQSTTGVAITPAQLLAGQSVKVEVTATNNGPTARAGGRLPTGGQQRYRGKSRLQQQHGQPERGGHVHHRRADDRVLDLYGAEHGYAEPVLLRSGMHDASNVATLQDLGWQPTFQVVTKQSQVTLVGESFTAPLGTANVRDGQDPDAHLPGHLQRRGNGRLAANLVDPPGS